MPRMNGRKLDIFPGLVQAKIVGAGGVLAHAKTEPPMTRSAADRLQHPIFQQYVPPEVRMRVSRALRFVLALLAVVSMWPALARADSSVVVLGVRSLDGDDTLAHEVSLALRAG